MESSQLSRLQKEQEKGLEICLTKIEKWVKFEEDYKDLESKMNTLPDKLSYDVKIPMSSVAFAIGKHVHTNEVNVLLGDNWFAERSCKQAGEIVRRRILQCDAMLKKLREEESQLRNWFNYTDVIKDEVEQCVDIREDYVEEAEKVWREQHKKNVQKHREEERQKQSRIEFDFDVFDDDDDDENSNVNVNPSSLSVINAPNKSSAILKSSGPSGDVGALHNQARRVSWHEDPVININEEDNLDDDVPSPLRIIVKHTFDGDTDSDLELDGDNFECVQTISSPADVYGHFASWLNKIPKSILKSSSRMSPCVTNLETSPSPEPRSETSKDERSTCSTDDSPPELAVSEVVVERDPTVNQPFMNKRMFSRFKASRR